MPSVNCAHPPHVDLAGDQYSRSVRRYGDCSVTSGARSLVQPERDHSPNVPDRGFRREPSASRLNQVPGALLFGLRRRLTPGERACGHKTANKGCRVCKPVGSMRAGTMDRAPQPVPEAVPLRVAYPSYEYQGKSTRGVTSPGYKDRKLVDRL